MPTPITSTGIPALDKALGKSAAGYPLGRITELHGLQRCGSSAVAIAAASAALDEAASIDEGYKVVVFDYGGDILERLPVEDGLMVHVNYAQDHPPRLITEIHNAVRAGVRLVVIDSIDRILGDRRQFNWLALSQKLAGSTTSLLVVRRYAEHPDPSPWDALAYHSDLRIRLSCHKDEDEPELHKVRADLIKVRAGKPRTANFYLRDGLVEAARKSRRKGPESGPSRFDREDII